MCTGGGSSSSSSTTCTGHGDQASAVRTRQHCTSMEALFTQYRVHHSAARCYAGRPRGDMAAKRQGSSARCKLCTVQGTCRSVQQAALLHASGTVHFQSPSSRLALSEISCVHYQALRLLCCVCCGCPQVPYAGARCVLCSVGWPALLYLGLRGARPVHNAHDLVSVSGALLSIALSRAGVLLQQQAHASSL